ncbi:angiopoietin-related protein 3-like [Drosophila albomicans]|uniref:Angiopoietin-related protein 3-like n=1 Tax=Drosophila albomicans TaxID=7291 RepID=A0A6P8W9K6_DROAB|nr:angiopoietin-related protein 3-like [Drosophila albomicans]
MRKFFKVFAVFFIIVKIWSVSCQSTDGEFITTTNLPNEGKTTSVNDVEISNLENHFVSFKTQTETPLSNILRSIQNLQTNNDNFESKLKEKDDIIACQKTQLEDKSNILEFQINETSKARQEASDYKHQIEDKELEIKNLQSTISSYKLTIDSNNEIISKLDLENKRLDQERNEDKKKLSEIVDCESEFDNDYDTSYRRPVQTAYVRQMRYPSSCLNLSAGKQKIQIGNGSPFDVFCDWSGWMTIQQRKDGSISFDRNWENYAFGFGDLEGDFWLGLDKLHQITNSTRQELQIFVRYSFYTSTYEYDDFKIASADEFYELKSLGNHKNKFNYTQLQENTKFSTYDRHLGESVDRCAEDGDGGWWYGKDCGKNLNSPYRQIRTTTGIQAKGVSMQIRPYTDKN